MKTYKFKLYNSKKNKKLHKRCNLAGVVYNHAIALHKRYYKIYKKYPSYIKMQNHFTKICKLEKFSYFSDLGSQAVQNILKRIDFGYQKFFRKENKRPPTFKKVKGYKSFALLYVTKYIDEARTIKQIIPSGYKLLDGNKIKIGKVIYSYHKSRDILGNVKQLTIKRDKLGDFYLFFTTDHEESKEQVATGKTAGFDFGLKTFLVDSDGKELDSPLFFKKSIQAIKKANRNLSRKVKGSNNRKKARLHLARIHKKVANQRLDFHFKLAKQLATSYDSIYFEDLNLTGMVRLWGRKISDLGFSQFLNIQKWMCQKYQCNFGQIDRWFPSSKSCSICWAINENLNLKDREWTCDCGAFHKRDHNAAKVIKTVGTSTVTGVYVRRSQNAIDVDGRIPGYRFA